MKYTKEYKLNYVDDEKTYLREFENTGATLDMVKSKIINKLDYSLKYAEDRSALVNKLLKENEWIYELFSTERFINKQIKNQNDFLLENNTRESLEKMLDQIAQYIDHPRYNNEYEEKIDECFKQRKKKKMMVKKNTLSKRKERNDRKREGLSDNIEKQEKISGRVYSFGKFKKHNRNKQKILKEDLIAYPYLLQIQYTLNKLEDILGYKKVNNMMDYKKFESILNKNQLMDFLKDNDLRDILGIKNKTKNNKDDYLLSEEERNQLKKLKKIYADLNKEMLIIKEKLKGTIYFKRLDKESTVVDLESDTGYIDENGDYIEVSENKFDFKNKHHVKSLIIKYPEIKDEVSKKIDSQLWVIIFVLEEIIKKAELTTKEKFILKLHFEDCDRKTIKDEYQYEFHEELSDDYLSRVLNEYIPSKVHKAFLDDYDEWLYTYKVRGKYKKCSKCGEIKLISNDRYFSKKDDSKDGFHPYCKKCR